MGGGPRRLIKDEKTAQAGPGASGLRTTAPTYICRKCPSLLHGMPSPSQLNARRELAFLVLAGLFLGSMSLLNVLGLSRFINLGRIGPLPIVVTMGVLPYPVTFLCTDVISEIWGERRASRGFC